MSCCGASLLAAQSPSIEAYAALNHVLVSPRGDTSGAVDRALADFGLKRLIALLVATYLALPAALAASDLVATVPSRTARQIAATAEIEILPLPVDLTATVSMAWHRRSASEMAGHVPADAHLDAGGNVNQKHGGGNLVDVLPAGSARGGQIFLHIGGIELHFDFFGLRQHGHGCS